MTREFLYYSGEIIKLDDIVRSAGHPGVIVMIIQPDTQNSIDYSCPLGGVMVEEDWNGTKSLLLMEPPDGSQWEDLEFVARKFES